VRAHEGVDRQKIDQVQVVQFLVRNDQVIVIFLFQNGQKFGKIFFKRNITHYFGKAFKSRKN